MVSREVEVGELVENGKAGWEGSVSSTSKDACFPYLGLAVEVEALASKTSEIES